MSATQDTPTTSPIGRSTPRVDGPLKVSGKAQYTSDFHFPGTLYAVPVEATIANGRVVTLDTAAAEKMPGVRAILHRDNIGTIFRSIPEPGFEGICEERRPPFEDDVVRYYGQYIALAVADTFETAKAAADAVRVMYATETPNVATDLTADDDPEAVVTTFGMRHRVDSQRGDAEAAFASAPVKIDHTYVTPAETHNPIELHATTAIWDGLALTLYDSSQGVVNCRSVLAQMFGLPKENVRVITKFVGSGFGGKLFPWTHCALAAAAARQVGKPVKLVLSRKMMFQTVGHRPRTQQRVRLGATREGKLVSLQHDYVYHRSMLDAHHEDCGEATPFQYSVPNLRVTFGRAKRHIGAAADMRGPGRVPGLYATESAMNELADALKIDPVRLRVINEPTIDEGRGLPFSSRHLLECFVLGAEQFGWAKRTPESAPCSAMAPSSVGAWRAAHGWRNVSPPQRASSCAMMAQPASPVPHRTSAPARIRSWHNSLHRRPVCHSTRSRRCSVIRHCRKVRSLVARWRLDRSCRPSFRRQTMRSQRCSLSPRQRWDRRSSSARPRSWHAQVAGLCQGGRPRRRRAVRGGASPRQPTSRHREWQVRSDLRESAAAVLDALVWLSFRRGHVAAGARAAARQPGRDRH